MADRLEDYRRKRDARSTPEPAGDAGVRPAAEHAEAPRFVVQEHHATRLHWDLRLEHGGVAVSWAIPNGIPQDPKENRLAVHTEDHPLEYLEFEGDIPQGSYGAGTMRIWDRGTYEEHKFDDDKVEITFHGERLNGRYGLFPLKRKKGEPPGKDWMIHRMDPPSDPTGQPMPARVKPMLARPGALPPDDARWAFEIKWDGVRALVYSEPGRIRFESRNGNDVTSSYPELKAMNRALSSHRAILDGEIVAFGEDGRPSFSRLQSRMHVASECRGPPAGEGGAGGVPRVRPAVARRPLAARAALHPAAGAPERARARGPGVAHPGPRRRRRRGRARRDASRAGSKGSSRRSSTARTSPAGARPAG